jgi:pilus assembly protein Flp/PilA
MKSFLRNLWRDECGQDLTEYALLLVLIALAAAASMKGLATALNGVYTSAAESLNLPP